MRMKYHQSAMAGGVFIPNFNAADLQRKGDNNYGKPGVFKYLPGKGSGVF